MSICPVHCMRHRSAVALELNSTRSQPEFTVRYSGEKVAAVSKKRIEAVPLAAYVLSRMVDAIQPDRLVFSAFGLREGHLYDLLPADQGLGWHENPATLEPQQIAGLLRSGDVVVVKGSKKMFWVNKFVPRLVAALRTGV